MRNRNFIFISFLIFFVNVSYSQINSFISTNLNDPLFYENKIKYITDEELINSLDFDVINSGSIRLYLNNKDFEKVYRELGLYFSKKKYPKFIMDKDNLLVTFDEIEKQIKSDSGFMNNINKKSESVLKNIIDGWGGKTYEFDSVIDFNTIQFGHIGKYGFHYFSWSQVLNYMYILTKDEIYLKKLENIFNDWYTQRYRVKSIYPENDIIYYELGLGGRLNIFLPFYIQNPSKLNWITNERILKTFLGTGRWLYEVENKLGYRTGNWQPIGSYALIMLGLYFPEFKEAKEWVKIGAQRILEHLKYDYYQDGGHSERSPGMYSILTYCTLRNSYYLLQKFNYNLQVAEFKKYFIKMIDWWISMITPNGEMPPLNDSHRATFPKRYFLEKVNLFDDFSGLGILRTIYQANNNYPLPEYTSINNDSSGFAIMRSDWSNKAYYLNVTYGKFVGYHTHNDLLSFEIYALGKAHIIDASIGRTYDDTLYNLWYRTPHAHNTISLDSKYMTTKYDSTMDRMNYCGEDVKWVSLNGIDYFSSSHNAYHRYNLKHKREIIFVKPFYWLVIDSLKGNDCDWIWNIHSLDTIKRRDNYYQTTDTNGIIIYPLNNYKVEFDFGMAMVKNDIKDDDYKKINWLKIKKEDNKTDCIEVIYFPYLSKKPNLNCTKILNNNKKIIYDDYEDEIYLGGNINNMNISSDANIVIIRKKAGKIFYSVIIGGTYLKYENKYIIKNNKIGNYEYH